MSLCASFHLLQEKDSPMVAEWGTGPWVKQNVVRSHFLAMFLEQCLIFFPKTMTYPVSGSCPLEQCLAWVLSCGVALNPIRVGLVASTVFGLPCTSVSFRQISTADGRACVWVDGCPSPLAVFLSGTMALAAGVKTLGRHWLEVCVLKEKCCLLQRGLTITAVGF